MKKLTGLTVFPLLILFFSGCRSNNPTQEQVTLKTTVTRFDKTSLLKEATLTLQYTDSANGTLFEIDPATKYQTIDGFGFALTGGSAYLIQQKLTKAQKDSLLADLFSASGIGVSYLRISMGASDLDDHVFSYCDLPTNQQDPNLEKFDIAPDKENLIPVLKEILQLNPQLKIMATPWSPPVWMKTNLNSKGGSLKSDFYKSYANYFTKYISAMENEGIKIEAITLQNEPENPNNNPSMLMTAEEEALFVKQFIGPAFASANIKTKILVFDHNADHPEYPISVLDDNGAANYVDGSAFHLYLGDVTALAKVHLAHPDKNIYFTEQWTGAKGQFSGDLDWHTKNIIIGATKNWAKAVIEWNLASDKNYGPHTDGGCTECLGAVTIDNGYSKNVSYYIIAQASKFVKSGSARVRSTENLSLPSVAFLTPSGEKVLIILNESKSPTTISIKMTDKFISTSLQSESVTTIVLP